MQFLPRKLITTLIASTALGLTACEVGKNSTKIELVGYDVSSGYYRTAPQSLDLSYKVNGVTLSQPALVQNIPIDMREIMTDPMLVLVEDPVSGATSLRNSADTGIGVAGLTLNQKSGKLGKSASGYATYKNCRLDQSILYDGDILKLSEQIFNGFKTRGQLNLDYQLAYRITGVEQDCIEWLSHMRDCYSDESQCEAGNNTIVQDGFVHSLFDPFVDSNAFTVNAIPDVRNLQVDISYR